MKRIITKKGNIITIKTVDVHPNTKNSSVLREATKAAMRYVVKEGIPIKKWSNISHGLNKYGMYITKYKIQKVGK